MSNKTYTPVVAKEWKFEQKEKPFGHDKRTMVLRDYGAPFGRPRQKAVIKDKLIVRTQTVRYPGNPKPTRHLFGTHHEDMEISGRWMDHAGGFGGAHVDSIVAAWQEFIRDQVLVHMQWGDVIGYMGIIDSLEIAWESPYEVAWTMHFLVESKDGENDDDSVRTTRKPRPAPIDPSELKARMDAIFSPKDVDGSFDSISAALAAIGEFGEQIDSAVSKLSELTSTLVKISDQISNFEQASFGTLERFRSALHNLKTGLISFEELISNAKEDSVLVVRSSEADALWAKRRVTTTQNISDLLFDIAEQDAAAEVAQRGQGQGSYVATIGDTWETISANFFGDVLHAGAIRSANGIKQGVSPAPGTTYKIP